MSIIASYTGTPDEVNAYLNGRIYINPLRWQSDLLGNPERKRANESWVEYHNRIAERNEAMPYRDDR